MQKFFYSSDLMVKKKWKKRKLNLYYVKLCNNLKELCENGYFNMESVEDVLREDKFQ